MLQSSYTVGGAEEMSSLIVDKEKNRGLSASQLKWIALITMTIDHLAAYGFEIPVFEKYFNVLRVIGRIAAPLFLFLLTESMRYTRDKKKYVLRLYLGAVGTGLFVTITNLLFDDSIGRFLQRNILFTYFYTALYILLLEEILNGIRQKKWYRCGVALLGISATVLLHFVSMGIEDFPYAKYNLSFEEVWTIKDVTASLIRSPLYTEYTILFTLMGILMYFVGNKYLKALVLVLFSAVCYLGNRIPFLSVLPVQSVLGFPQYYMALAAGFILLYNGKKGRGQKYFFYIYYPVHRYVISIAAYLFRMFG